MALVAEPGSVQLLLEVFRDERRCFVPVGRVGVVVPAIHVTPDNSVETGSDTLRAFLHYRMNVALAEGLREDGVYRIRFAGETIVDRWRGGVLVGCQDIPHVTDCGWFACPHR
jgi:hypothetical protein